MRDGPDDLATLRLLQLVSPSLPVGGYAYSQGLEWAVEAGWVTDAESFAGWLRDQLDRSIAVVDLPVLARLHEGARRADEPSMLRWAGRLGAMRETSELASDDWDRGRALIRLLDALDVAAARPWLDRPRTPFAVAFALAAVHWGLPLEPTLAGYAWAWLENQVTAGIKLIPLGQVGGQRLLLDLARHLPPACERARASGDDDLGGTLPAVAIASSLHETQYTRLFRS